MLALYWRIPAYALLTKTLHNTLIKNSAFTIGKDLKQYVISDLLVSRKKKFITFATKLIGDILYIALP
jgi:hypothetical protein